jgi:predicted pyridoxine 5'-phosphate oxidase superfamily flavin-nucleotide-binding protein
VKNPPHERDAVGKISALDFLSVKFNLVERSLNEFLVEAVRDHAPQGLEYKFFDLPGILLFRTAQADGEGNLLEVPLQARYGRQILAQA